MIVTGFRYTASPENPLRISLFGYFTYQEAYWMAEELGKLLSPILKKQNLFFCVYLNEFTCSIKAAEDGGVPTELTARYHTTKNIRHLNMPEPEDMRSLIVKALMAVANKVSEQRVQPGEAAESTRGWGPIIDIGNGDADG